MTKKFNEVRFFLEWVLVFLLRRERLSSFLVFEMEKIRNFIIKEKIVLFEMGCYRNFLIKIMVNNLITNLCV